MSFTNVLNQQLIGTSTRGYNAIILDDDITLSWPTNFQLGNNIVAGIMDVSPTEEGFTLTLPNAKQVSVGYSFLINNPTDTDFYLLDNSGAEIATIAGPSINAFYLIDNTTQGGTWRQIPYGGGYAAVTSVGVEFDFDSTENNMTVDPSEITTSGNFVFSFQSDLEALVNFGTSTGIATRTGVGTWSLGSLMGTSGQIFVTNGDAVSGPPTFSLYQNITGLQSIRVGNLSLCNMFGTAANTISSTNPNGNINLSPNGTGAVTSSGNVQILGGDSLVLQSTDGTKNVSLNASTATANYSIQLPVVPPGESEGVQVLMATVSGTTVTTGWQSSTDLVTGTISARVMFNGTNGNVYTQFGVSGVARNSTGNYTITFSPVFENINYSCVGGITGGPGVINFSPVSVGVLTVTTYALNGSLMDFNTVSVWVSIDN